MPTTLTIRLTTAGNDTGPLFNILSDYNFYSSPIQSGVDKSVLTASTGYTITVPDGTTKIRIQSLGKSCGTFTEVNVPGPNIVQIQLLRRLNFDPNLESTFDLCVRGVREGPNVTLNFSDIVVQQFSSIFAAPGADPCSNQSLLPGPTPNPPNVTVNNFSVNTSDINFYSSFFGGGICQVLNSTIGLNTTGLRIIQLKINGIPITSDPQTITIGSNQFVIQGISNCY